MTGRKHLWGIIKYERAEQTKEIKKQQPVRSEETREIEKRAFPERVCNGLCKCCTVRTEDQIRSMRSGNMMSLGFISTSGLPELWGLFQRREL